MSRKKLPNNAASQRARILQWLRKGKPLTTIDARAHLQIMHPAQRVLELRGLGFPIETVWVMDETPEQGRHRVASYLLRSGDKR